MAMTLQNFISRFVVFLIAFALWITCCYRYPRALLGPVTAFCCLGSLYEWVHISGSATAKLIYPTWTTYLPFPFACLTLAAAFINVPRNVFIAILVWSLMLPFLVHLVLFDRLKLVGDQALLSFQRMTMDVVGILYTVLPLSHLGFMQHAFTELGGGYCFLSMMVSWSIDGGGMMFGNTALGLFHSRHPLISHVSPGKTVEGLFGGIFSGLIMGFTLKYIDENVSRLFLVPVPSEHMFVLCFLAGFINTFGDLCESYFKRAFKVKDSGTFFRGHGGFMDKTDGAALVAFFLYYYVTIVLPIPAHFKVEGG